MKVFEFSNARSKEIPSNQIYFADHDIHYAMFIANVKIFWPLKNKVVELRDYYVGFSSSEELIKVCDLLLHERVFGYPKPEKYIIWPTEPCFSFVLLSIDLLNGDGSKVVSEGSRPCEESFSKATYQTIIRSKPKHNPPWLVTVEIYLHLTEIGERKFLGLFKPAMGMS